MCADGLGAGGGGGGDRGGRGRGRVTTGLDIQPETFYQIKSAGEDLNVCLRTRTEVRQWLFNQIKYVFSVH